MRHCSSEMRPFSSKERAGPSEKRPHSSKARPGAREMGPIPPECATLKHGPAPDPEDGRVEFRPLDPCAVQKTGARGNLLASLSVLKEFQSGDVLNKFA